MVGGFFSDQVIAEHLSVEEVAGIKEGFHMMDTGNRGKINIDELRVGLHKLGHQIPDADLQILMEAVSITPDLSLFHTIKFKVLSFLFSKTFSLKYVKLNADCLL